MLRLKPSTPEELTLPQRPPLMSMRVRVCVEPEERPALCRAAGLAFIADDAVGWGAGELSLWLAGPYRQATMVSDNEGGGSLLPEAELTADPDQVRDMRDARRFASAAVRAAQHGRLGFARAALMHGDVVEVAPIGKQTAYAPMDRPCMPLAHRVLSLIAVEALMSRTPYADVATCSQCGLVRVRRGRGCYACEREAPSRRGGWGPGRY